MAARLFGEAGGTGEPSRARRPDPELDLCPPEWPVRCRLHHGGRVRADADLGRHVLLAADRFPLGLRAGWLGERKTLLGGAAQGAFGSLAAGTAFVGIEAETVLGGWRLGANAESGTVSPAARGGVIDAISSLATSTFTLHASRPLANAGIVRVSISQPLARRAWASLAHRAGRSYQGRRRGAKPGVGPACAERTADRRGGALVSTPGHRRAAPGRRGDSPARPPRHRRSRTDPALRLALDFLSAGAASRGFGPARRRGKVCGVSAPRAEVLLFRQKDPKPPWAPEGGEESAMAPIRSGVRMTEGKLCLLPYGEAAENGHSATDRGSRS